MKKILSFLVCLVFCVSLSLAAEDTEYYSYSYARLSYVNGDVFIQRAGDNGFEEGDVNLLIVEGDKIGTRDGRAEIHFGKKNYLRIDRQTQLDLIKLPEQGSDIIQLHMLSGDIFLRVNYLQREKDFEIHTPDASYYVLEEGLYRFVVRENVQTEVLVYEGTLEAAGQDGSVVVNENESLYAIDGAFRSDSSDYYTEYDDSFANWSSSRDELQSRYVDRRYLPSELEEYETELAYNGRWMYEAPYGYVWIPTVSQTYWRPYNYGRWVWYPIIGWTWVSSHSWGWCTSRYGRWHWRNTWGWYWIPTRRWGPAWVHWHHGYDYLGWSPLSYWNRPVVIVNNHFYGRNNDAYYPNQSRALTVIRKNQLQARNISKVALSQDSVGRIGKISLSSRQPNLKSMVDRTSEKYSTASKVLSRTNLRQVSKNYSSGKTINSLSLVKSTSIRTPSSSLKNSGAIKTPSSRAIKRYSPGSQTSVTSRSAATQGKGIAPSRFKSSAQSVKPTTPSRSASAVTKRSPSSSPKSTKSGDTSNTQTKSIVKRFSSSSPQTPSRTSTTSKSSTTTEKKSESAVKKIVKKFSSTSSSSASLRGRAATAPSRSSTSSSSTVRRPSSSSSVQRSTSRAPARSSVSSRSTPSRSLTSSGSTIRRPGSSSSVQRSASRAPARNSVSSRSTPSRTSSPSRSTVSQTSKSSSSSRSSVSRSSSSKTVKKK